MCNATLLQNAFSKESLLIMILLFFGMKIQIILQCAMHKNSLLISLEKMHEMSTDVRPTALCATAVVTMHYQGTRNFSDSNADFDIRCKIGH